MGPSYLKASSAGRYASFVHDQRCQGDSRNVDPLDFRRIHLMANQKVVYVFLTRISEPIQRSSAEKEPVAGELSSYRDAGHRNIKA